MEYTKGLFMQETALCLPEKKDRQEVCAVCSLMVLPSLKHTCAAQLGGICVVPRQVVEAGLCHTMARALSSSHSGENASSAGPSGPWPRC